MRTMRNGKGLLVLGTLAAMSAAPAVLARDYKYDQGRKYSTIGDNPVAVGDKNRYELDFDSKKFNVATNPIGWTFGSFGLSGAYALHQNIALRGELDYATYPSLPKSFDGAGVALGLGAPMYFTKTFTGFFVEPGLLVQVISYTHTTSATSVIASVDASGHRESHTTVSTKTTEKTIAVFGPNALFGYHWMWDSGFNLALAAGGGRNLSAADINDDDGKLEFAREFFTISQLNVGYAFN